MKKQYILTLTAALILTSLFTSCYSGYKFTVTGQPGTEVYLPNGNRVGTIPLKGELKTKTPSDSCYYAYMVAKDPQTGAVIPFGMNYQRSNYRTYYGSLGIFGGGASLVGGVVTGLLSENIAIVSIGVAAGVGLYTWGGQYIGSPWADSEFRSTPTPITFNVPLSSEPSLPAGPPKYLSADMASETVLSTPAATTSSQSATTTTPLLDIIKGIESGAPVNTRNTAAKEQKVTQSEKKATAAVNSADLFRHTVVAGETLADIAKAYGVSIPAIIKANRDAGTPLNDSKLTPGQKIVIPL